MYVVVRQQLVAMHSSMLRLLPLLVLHLCSHNLEVHDTNDATLAD